MATPNPPAREGAEPGEANAGTEPRGRGQVEVRDFPARDIWSLGVIHPGLSQIHRVVGTPPPPSPPSVDHI